jgi:membrane peptidoglycan carboxypeptidase
MTGFVAGIIGGPGLDASLHTLALRRARALYFEGYGLLASLGERHSVFAQENAIVAHELALPEHLVRLVVAIEDKRFWTHPGIDPIALIRAAWMNSRTAGRRQGASSIREQVAKLARVDRPAHPLLERCHRAAGSLVSQVALGPSRQRVLTTYLEAVYVGRSCHGFHSAAEVYFGLSAADLSPGQALFLADRIALPNLWRAARLRNILQRRIVLELVRHDLDAIPRAYQRVFGAVAGSAIGRVIDDIRDAHRS